MILRGSVSHAIGKSPSLTSPRKKLSVVQKVGRMACGRYLCQPSYILFLGGPPLLLIHDGIYNRTAWHIQMDILSKQFRVFAPDLPGHGSRMDEPLTLKAVLDVLKTLVETQIPQKRALVLGMGFGGLLAIVFAAQYPDLVFGIIACGSCSISSNAKVMYDLKGTLYKMLPGGFVVILLASFFLSMKTLLYS
jgi:pimeloyl-ACP methyl ester carboxylesterase